MEEKIKVAIISQSMKIGGGEMMAAKLAGYINPEKYQIMLFVIASEQDNQIKALINESHIQYKCLNLSTSFSFKNYQIFSQELLSFNPDVIHVHLDFSYSWIWSIIHRTPLICTMHSDPHRHLDKRIRAIIKLKSFQRNLKMVGCAGIISEMVVSCYNINRNQVTTIYNPVDVKKYKKQAEHTNDFSFICVGRFSPIKNHHMLIEAMSYVHKKYPNAMLYLAGEGELMESVSLQVKEAGLDNNVVFLGNVDNIPDLLPTMDVLVLSSKSEACPMVILEAMASEVPVIGTRVGGVPELITNNGMVVDCDDVEGFARAMCKMIEKPVMKEEMKANSRKLVKKYDVDMISQQYEKLYDDMRKKHE